MFGTCNWDYSPQDLHLVPEGLQLLGRGFRHFEDFDGHVSVPLALVDSSEGAGADALLHGHLPRMHLPVVAGVPVAHTVLAEVQTQH